MCRWDNDAAADIVCRQLGYSGGSIYTFGHTSQLPSLPVVAGYRTCTGSEQSILACPEGGNPTDRECHGGCLGPDGRQGTDDDSMDAKCTHTIDQGAICNGVWPSQVALETCQGSGEGGRMQNTNQPVVFSCIDYYTTECTFDVTNTNLRNGVGNYMEAMRAFATCADAAQEAPGYCHGSLKSASNLANHDVCINGATQNIGFHIRIPFVVNMAGAYAFRMHADYGLGSYMGVDGAEFAPGNIYGHVESDVATLAIGDHELESLGFEDCCDGWAMAEVHLPCDAQTSPWRVIAHGDTDCLVCGAVLEETCLAETYQPPPPPPEPEDPTGGR